MGGGMPLGAFIASKTMMQCLTENPTLGHITTFGGHPVSCAAALAQLQILLDDNIIPSVIEKGELFIQKLKHYSLVKEIRGKGLMLAVEMQSEKQCIQILKKLTENGIITDPFIFNVNSFRIAPPLTITKEQIDECCEVIWNIFNA
jgi:acetylornithine/succinyldiaminopimelate/putrescine aminotransferase